MNRLFLLLFIITLASCNQKEKNRRMQNAREDIEILENIRGLIIEKMIPDSIRDMQHDASHDLMYTDYDSPSYWHARSQIHETQKFIDSCSEFKLIERLIEEKKLELNNH